MMRANFQHSQVIGFPPILNANNNSATHLVLGSAPSMKSLQEHQYYAHPQNAFWWIMSELFGFDVSLSYQERVDIISQKQIVVWDVLARCQREGSLDSQIKNEEPNDMMQVLKDMPRMKVIACNGAASFRLLKKYFPTLFESHYQIVQLPSTSPAYASMSRQEKLEKWRKALVG